MDFDEAANAYRKRPFLEVDDRERNGTRGGAGEGEEEEEEDTWSSDEEIRTSRRNSIPRINRRVRSPVQQVPMSTWFRWVSERKAAHENRLHSLAEQQRQMEQNRVPTPVKKARLESQALTTGLGRRSKSPTEFGNIVFGADPTLASDLRGLKAEEGGKKKKKGKKFKAIEVEPAKLTAGQWRLLHAYWNHSLFVVMRIISLFVSLAACVFASVAVGTEHWVSYQGVLLGDAGLWHNCSFSSNRTIAASMPAGCSRTALTVGHQ